MQLCEDPYMGTIRPHAIIFSPTLGTTCTCKVPMYGSRHLAIAMTASNDSQHNIAGNDSQQCDSDVYTSQQCDSATDRCVNNVIIIIYFNYNYNNS